MEGEVIERILVYMVLFIEKFGGVGKIIRKSKYDGLRVKLYIESIF